MRRFLNGVLTMAAIASASVAFGGNQETADQVASNLKYYGNLSGRYSLDVNVENGTAVLSGYLADQSQLDRVIEIARRSPGVTKVVTTLTVQNTAAQVANSPLNGGVTQTAMQQEVLTPISATESAQLAAPGSSSMAVSGNQPLPMGANTPMPIGGASTQYEQPNLPNHAWPSYAAYPNYAGVCYPKKYCADCFPNIGPFYPYPEVPAEWRKVTLEWHDGYWYLDFDDGSTGSSNVFNGLFRPFH